MKAKTSNGFVPNCATAGAKSQDRTEPDAGAKVLWEFYKKCASLAYDRASQRMLSAKPRVMATQTSSFHSK